MNRSHRLAAAWITACCAMAAPPGEITGTVIDGETGKPIPHARVTAPVPTGTREAYGDMLVVLTGDDGHFRFSGLPESSAVSAEKAGYTSGILFDPLRARPDNRSVPLTLRLMPLGGVTVRVVDDSGSSIDGVQVRIERRGQGNPQILPFSGGSYTVAKDGTRVPLIRGSYGIVAASPGTGNLLRARGQTFLPTYYPGTTSVSRAEWVDVVPGKEIQAEMRITPIPARQIHGRIGFAGTLNQVSVLSADGKYEGTTRGLPQWSYDSSEFHVYGLAPGTYPLEIRACSGVPCRGGTFRKTVQVVDADIDNLVISDADRLPDR